MWGVDLYDVVPDILGNNPDFSANSTFSDTLAGCATGDAGF